jgi:uncharacterized membrane protein SpoIIM required for sporulation/uncharacterized RDD family membrane protein YckC
VTPTPPTIRDFRQHLEVETPEHVVLDLEIAGIGSRALAALVDMLILTGAMLAVSLVLGLLGGFGLTLGRWGAAFLLLAGFGAWTGYFIFFEAVRRGQTPGKRMVGIRVLMDTGHAVTPGAAAVRNLLRLADFLPPPYLAGLLLIAFHPRAKRLGDLVAGTVVARDRPGDVASAGPAAATEDPGSSLPELSDAEYDVLLQFERRQADLVPSARGRLAASLAARLPDHPPDGGIDDATHLLRLLGRERARREGGVTGRALAGTGARFSTSKRQRWDEFHRLAERASRSGLDSFAAHELPDFAARYREVAADLSRARTYRVDERTLARLERLVAAGHNALYRDDRGTWRRLGRVLTRECPAAIVRARGYVLVACLAFSAPAAAGFALMRGRPALAAEVLPDVVLSRASAGLGRQAAGQRYVDVAAEDRPLMASGIISNNVRVAIACFAGGIFLGIGSLVLLGFNGLLIGATAGHFANSGLLDYLLEFIVGHGLLELIAIWVAGAAGFLLGRTAVAPGELSRADALVISGRTAVRMLGGAAVLLVVAGLIEGFVSASAGDYTVRLGASAASLVFLALYLLGGRGEQAG